jgi:hypothetical protein
MHTYLRIVGRRYPALLIVLLIASASLATGCASYVNIPPDDEDTAIHSVNFAPVPGVMARSLSFAATAYPSRTSTPAVMVPEGANESTIASAVAAVVEAGLAGASTWTGIDDSRTGYRILTVRVRGSSAIVEILLPPSSAILDGRRLLEVNLRGDLRGWRVESARRYFATDERISQGAKPALPTAVDSPDSSTDGEPETPAAPEEFIDLEGAVTPGEGRLEVPTKTADADS